MADPKSKLPPRRIPSDTCAVWLGRTIADGKIDNPGTPHYIHEGEWIEVSPVLSVGALLALIRLQEKGIGGATLAEMETNMTILCQELSHRVLGWNWTDLMGAPLLQPYGHAEVMASLTTDELVWLLGIITMPETRDERKNA